MRSALPLIALSLATPTCGGHTLPTTTEACDCSTTGHGARICEAGACGPCMCLIPEFISADHAPAVTFYVDPDVPPRGDGSAASPWRAIAWPAVDEALATGDVQILFSALEADGRTPERWPARMDILRTDMGPFHVSILGGSYYNRDDAHPEWATSGGHVHAIVPGISTGFEDVPRHRVTLRGFEVTGSEDKGVYWRAGDGVVLEDLVVHDNGGTPAINFEYANRTNLPSTGFTLHNSHIYNQFQGECVYIGGSEGEDQDAHRGITLTSNLIHHCWDPVNIKHDGINIKDRLTDVRVEGNVIFTTNWGIELASPGVVRGNLIFDTYGNGMHLNDYWGTGLSGLTLEGNIVLRAGEHGIRLDAENQAATGVRVTDTLVQGSRDAGLLLGGVAGLQVTVEGLTLAENGVGIDGWGDVALTLEDCALDDNGEDDAGVMSGATDVCRAEALDLGDLSNPAGPDGIFFSGDEGYLGG